MSLLLYNLLYESLGMPIHALPKILLSNSKVLSSPIDYVIPLWCCFDAVRGLHCSRQVKPSPRCLIYLVMRSFLRFNLDMSFISTVVFGEFIVDDKRSNEVRYCSYEYSIFSSSLRNQWPLLSSCDSSHVSGKNLQSLFVI